MKTSLLPYKIGLAAIGVFVLSIVIFVLSQAGATKQDTQTYNTANDISQKLATYIDEQGTIPTTLQDAGIHSVPSTISYTKLSDQSYKFCMTYKAKDDGLNSSSIAQTLIMAGDPALSDVSTSTTTDTLIISPSHKKGATCQTITPPYLSSNFGGSSNDTLNYGTGGGTIDTYNLSSPTYTN